MNSSPKHPLVPGRSFLSAVIDGPRDLPEKLESAPKEDRSYPPLGPPSQASLAGGARRRAARGGGGDRDPRPSSPAQEGGSSADETPSRAQVRAAKRASRAFKKEEMKEEAELNPFIVPGTRADAPVLIDSPSPKKTRKAKRAAARRAAAEEGVVASAGASSESEAKPAVLESEPPLATAAQDEQLHLQKMVVWGNPICPDGSDAPEAFGCLELFEALHQVLRARAEVSGWSYPYGLPVDHSHLRRFLVAQARTGNALTPLDLGEPAILYPLPTLNADHLAGLSRQGISYKAYLEQMHDCTRRGDLFMAALAAVVFNVRVLVLCPAATSSREPFWVVRHDFRPEWVVNGRCLVLTNPRAKVFGWAHPASTELLIASPTFGQHAEIMLRTTSLLQDWLPNEESSEEEQPAAVEPEILTSTLINALEEEYPDAQPYQIRACIICSTNAEGRPNLLRASKLLHRMLIADERVEGVLAADASADGTASSLRLPAAPANMGRRRAANQARRESDSSDDDGHILVEGGIARAAQLAARKRDREPTEQGCKPLKPKPEEEDPEDSDDQPQDAKPQDTKTQDTKTQDARATSTKIQDSKTKSAGTAQGAHSTACPAPVNASSCWSEGRSQQEQLQMLNDATSAVQQLAGCTHDRARDRLMLHLPHCETLEEAAELAIASLRAPITEIPNDGVSFVERLLGRGVRPATLKEMARATLDAAAPPRPNSELRPINLNTRLWDANLTDPHLSNLPHGTRTKLARRHAGESLHEEAADALRRFNQQRGAFDSPPARHAELQAHPNSAVRMAAQREFTQASAVREGPVIVVANTGAKPFQWKQGLEKEQRGFFWSTKQAVQQAWESSNRMDGEHAYRSFKSLVHQSMIPVICFELGLSPTEWEAIPDAELLSRIDAVLKPRDSTEYFLKLSAMKVDCNPSSGSLQTRYRAFAEPFIATLAEAVESGMAVNPEQAKNAFKAACNGHSLLKLWLSECKWKSVVEMHQRLVKGIKQYEAESVLRSLDCDSRTAPTQSSEVKQSEVQQGGGPQRSNQGPPPRQRQPFASGGGAAYAPVQPTAQLSTQVPVQPLARQVLPLAPSHVPSAFVNAATPAPTGTASRQHGGLDARGPHWHIPSEAFGCRTNPCNDTFCQICGNHGHDAANCKRFKHQQANHHGYFCEQRPGMGRLRYDGPLQERPPFQAPARASGGSAAAIHQFAPPPSHYAHAQGGGGGNVNASGQNSSQQGSAAINQASQTQPGAQNSAARQGPGGQQ